MSFFMNPFFEEFIGNWVLGDRGQSPAFVVKPNAGRSFDQVWNWTEQGSANIHDLDGLGANGGDKSILSIKLATNNDYTKFNTVSVDVAGATPAETTPSEIMAALNADPVFSTYFTASLRTHGRSANSHPATVPQQVMITSTRSGRVKFFIVNDGAEEVLGFNAKSGVGEMPEFFSRHTVGNLLNFADSQGSVVALSHVISNIAATGNIVTSEAHGLINGDLIRIENSDSTPVLDGDRTVTVVDENTFTVAVSVSADGTTGVWSKKFDEMVIANAVDARGSEMLLTLADARLDYELLAGRSGLFMFQKMTVDGSDRVTELIEYQAGASAGDLAKKTISTYDGSNLNPDQVVEVPYTLKSGDLVTP